MVNVDRRTFLLAGTASSVVDPLLAARPDAGPRAIALRTAMREQPLGIDDRTPSLSWQIAGDGVSGQSVYRILVAADGPLENASQAAIWDSGLVKSGETTGIIYTGSPLRSRARYTWRVMVWDDRGRASPWSEPAFWEMGLLNPQDWRGEWLAVESVQDKGDRDSKPLWVTAPGNSAQKQQFRLRFSTKGGNCTIIVMASEKVTGLSIAGRSLAIPYRDSNGYGGAPALKHELALSAGSHELLVDVVAPEDASRHVLLAGLVRVEQADGEAVRPARGWQAQAAKTGVWQEAKAAADQAHFPWPATPARLLRREFEVPRTFRSARLYLAALGGCRAWVNGRLVSSDELQSEPAEYKKHIPYCTYDIASLLRAGSNAIGVMVGDGNYASYQAPDGRFAYGPAPRRFRAMIEVTETGGAIHRIPTDHNWVHKESPVLMSEIYDGEDHDRRRWESGWAETGFSMQGWDKVWSAPDPQAPLVAPLCEPVRITRSLRPIAIRRIAERSHLIDFGQNFAGRVRLKVQGSRGDAIVVRHSEILDSEGHLDRRNLRVARAEDHYVLAGDGTETLEPCFTYQGFRYAQIDGVAELDAASVEGLVLSSALGEIGTLRLSQATLQKLWLNTLWSQRSNFMGIPTDCPQRDERLGWTGDAQIFWDTAAFNMDTGGFTRSYLRNVRADQAQNGAYPMWSPSPNGLGWGTTTATPGWADAGVMLPYVTYIHSGDRSIIDENWEAMSGYVSGVLATNPGGVWRNDRGADLGDWLALDAKQPGDPTTPKDLIATAMLARSIQQLQQMATWTGRSREASRWRQALQRTKGAFASEFITEDGTVGNGSQCSYILALCLGLAPEQLRQTAASKLVANIRERGILLSTGFLGTPLALDALADAGESKLVFDLLLRTEFPSWGYMVAKGATTIWERWNGDVGWIAMNSYNHYALGAVGSFLYRRIAGIEPIAPGFRHIRFAPLTDERIEQSGASVRTVQGNIITDIKRIGSKLQISLELPPNVSADIVLPGIERKISSGLHRFSVHHSE